MVVATVSDDLLVAAVGAVIGAALSVVTSLAFRLIGQRSRQRALLADVWREVDEIAAIAGDRLHQRRDGLRLSPPLGTEAWKVAREARALERLPADERAALIRLYDQVEAANYLGEQGYRFFIASMVGGDDSAMQLEAEANRLTTQPFDDVVNAAVAAKELRR